MSYTNRKKQEITGETIKSMSRGTEFLTVVTEKLKKRINEIEETIQEGQKEIEGMNEYYWENYTEMDQYGYENFDNQQALLNQVNAQTEQQKKRSRFKKMLDSPFFGSVDFIYEDEEEPEIFYIGIGSFSETAGSVPLIYDWRAPVCSLFYDFDKGTASYEAPLGRLEGEIVSKWQYKIRRQKMIYEFESDLKIDDDILKQELGANGDVQLKNIVRTIQREQNAIIRNTSDCILVIQGAAGSGKTSVALHRIAYLLYHDRKNLTSSNILILSPNSVFSDYISHILPELGEENIREMSFDLFAYRELLDVVLDCEDRYQHIEHQIKGESAAEKERYRFKQSREFTTELEGFLLELEDTIVNFKEIEFRGFQKSAEEILKLFYFKFQDIPLLSRMEAAADCFIDEYETLKNKDLSSEEREEIRSRFASLYETTDLYVIYNQFLEFADLPLLPDVPREKRVLSYEDVFPLLYLKYKLCRPASRKTVKHLVIDEMQDYSYLQYRLIDLLFSCPMTILGDRAQTIDDTMQDVLTFLPKLLGKEKVRVIEMKKSYRNTVEIASYAKKLAGTEDIQLFERHGRPVEEVSFSDERDAFSEIRNRLNLTDDGYETAAVLTMTEEEALRAYHLLKEQMENVFYIDRDSQKFQKGLTVTTFYMAKGLEFDQVFTLGGDPENAFFKQYRYISATRALHELYLYTVTLPAELREN